MQSVIYHLPLLLLAGGILVLLATGRPLIGNGTLPEKHARYRPLQLAASLSWLIALSVIGKPTLEYMQKHDWNADLVPSSLAMAVVFVAIATVYALLAGFIIFYFRALRNVNFFAGARMRSPYAALFMLVPITNLVVIPYLEYFTYHRSVLAAAPEQASRLRAALLVGSAFALLVMSQVFSTLDDPASSPAYDALSRMVLALCTGGAGGILTVRIIRRTVAAQELCAARLGIIAPAPTDGAAEQRDRHREFMSSVGVAVLLIAAVLTALFPALPSELLRLAAA